MDDTNKTNRRRLHNATIEIHEALDQLEQRDGLAEGCWLLDGTEALLRSAVRRAEQIQHCLAVYGQTTPPPPAPLTAAEAAA